MKNLIIGFLFTTLLLLTATSSRLLPRLWAQEGSNQRCAATYKVTSQWGHKFAAQIELTNGGQPMEGWTLNWVFPGGQFITQLANGRYVQNEAVVSVTNGDWNRTLQSGQKTVIAFQAQAGGAHPTYFMLNGLVCESESFSSLSILDRANGTPLLQDR